jgi:pimeloyl-ACP methyl ester carboxylesterase
VTIVLVHGGGTTAAFWDRLRAVLDRPAFAFDLPGRGAHPADLATVSVEDEVRSVVADVKASVGEEGPIHLVAHSSGGLVVPGVVAALGERVQSVVLNAASVPPEGGCGADCMQDRHREGVLLAREAGVELTPGPPADVEKLRTSYGGEPLDDETLAYVADPVRSVVDTLHHYFQPVHWSIAGDVPVTYVVNDLDRPVPLALQEEMVGRLPHPPRVVHLESGHIPPVTDPARFAEILAATVAA